MRLDRVGDRRLLYLLRIEGAIVLQHICTGADADGLTPGQQTVGADAGGGVLLITHDIELALRVADRVAVFNDGTVIEETGVENFSSPSTLRHPFSRALWHAMPGHEFAVAADAAGKGDE